jgi:membrane fusion protein, multidrug efflux system
MRSTGPVARGDRLLALLCASVVTATAHAETPRTDMISRGVIRPVNQAAIATDLAVPVQRAPIREGQRFVAGEILIELDCRRPRAEHDAMAAVVREMKVTLDSYLALTRHGAGGKNDLEIARARLDKAEAERRSHAARLDQCRVVAPYDGVVVELLVHAHETTAPGKPMLSVLETATLEIEMIVDVAILQHVTPGRNFVFRIDELGLALQARVDRVGAAVDPVSRTIKIFAVPLSRPPGLLPGLSGSADFTRSDLARSDLARSDLAQ